MRDIRWFLHPLLSWVLIGAVSILGIILSVRYFTLPFRMDAGSAGKQSRKRRNTKQSTVGATLIAVFTAFVVSRVFLCLVYAIAGHLLGLSATLKADPFSQLLRWDAQHYLSLAENWYVATGDARLHLVFFPLYPLVVRVFHRALGLNVAFVSIVLSNVFLFLSGWALYRLVEHSFDRDTAERALRYFMFAPLSFFFSLPFSESLFFMLCVMCVLMARRRKFPWALLLGALASATRLLGLLCAIPVFYEYLLVVREKKGGVRMAVVSALKCTAIGSGVVGYLALNYAVSGNAFMFLTYQREHWSQTFGSLFYTMRYTVEGLFTYTDAMKWTTWGAQILWIVAMIVLIAMAFRRVSAGDGLYSVMYTYISVAPTWLLSGPRYLTGMYTVYPMIARLTANKIVDCVLMTLSCMLAGVMLIAYAYFNGVL